MTDNKQFKRYVIDYNKSKNKLKDEKINFEVKVQNFMRNKNIIIDQLTFFGNAFGVDIDYNIKRIPLDVLSDFCKEFGCEFEYTNCDGRRYIFSFDGLDIPY